MNTLCHLKHFNLEPWEGLNSRHYFDVEKGLQLRSSIRLHGVQETLLVASVEGKLDEARIIAGERRWRETNALIEELKEEIKNATTPEEVQRLKALAEDRMQMPCAVIPPEKVAEALELNLVENLCRADITPLEEAQGYERLRTSVNAETGQPHTIEEVALKVGQKPSYVHRRLKLRLAPAFFLDAVNAGQVSATIAELVGRIPDVKARKECAELILKPQDPAPEQEVPLNVEQAKALIRAHYMVSLKDCGFDPASDELVAVLHDEARNRIGGGSCADCPMRSGNLSELEGDLAEVVPGKGGGAGIDPNLCTNPGCHERKRDANWMIIRRAAEAKGQKVIDGDAARKVFSGYEGRVAYDSKYVTVDSKPTYAEGAGYGTPAAGMPWSKLIAGTKVPVVMAKNPHTGKVVTLVETKVAAAAVKKAKPELFERGGDEGEGSKASGKSKAHQPSKEELERQRLQAIETKARGFIMELAVQRLKVARPDDADVNALLLEILIESFQNHDCPTALTEFLGLEGYVSHERAKEAIGAELAKEKKGDGAATRRWLQTIVVAMVFDLVAWGASAEDDEMVRKVGKVLGVSVEKCFSQAEDGEGAKEPRECPHCGQSEVVPQDEEGFNDHVATCPHAEKVEELHECPECGQGKLTKTGIKSHNCAKRQAKKKAKPGKAAKKAKGKGKRSE